MIIDQQILRRLTVGALALGGALVSSCGDSNLVAVDPVQEGGLGSTSTVSLMVDPGKISIPQLDSFTCRLLGNDTNCEISRAVFGTAYIFVKASGSADVTTPGEPEVPLDTLSLDFITPNTADDSILPELEFSNNSTRGLLRFDCNGDFCEGETVQIQAQATDEAGLLSNQISVFITLPDTSGSGAVAGEGSWDLTSVE